MDARGKIIAARQASPCATLQEIAITAGVSRERVRQILKSQNLPTVHWKQQYQCLECGKILSRNKRFCSQSCSYKYTHPRIECENCHKLFRRSRSSLLRNRHLFCSKYCFGNWLGLKYGWGRSRSSNISKPPSKRRGVALDSLVGIWLDEGFTWGEIAATLNERADTLKLLYGGCE